MNKIYKLVWSKVRNAWVVASEIAKGHGKNASATRERKLLKTAVITAIMGGCLMTGGLASAALTEDQQAVYDAVLQKLETEKKIAHYFSVNSDDKKAPDGTNWNNDGATAKDSIAIGKDAVADGIAIGKGATSTDRSIVIGKDAKTLHNQNVAIGNNSYSQSEGVAIGEGTRSEGAWSVAIGAGVTAKNPYSVAISAGKTNTDHRHSYTEATNSSHATVLGNDSVVGKNNQFGIAIGSAALSDQSESGMAIGRIATVANSEHGIALGRQAEASNSKGGTVVGSLSKVLNSEGGLAMGYTSKVENSEGGVAYGPSAMVTESSGSSVAIGSGASVKKSPVAVAIGSNAKVENAGGAVAIGQNAEGIAKTSVAIGSYSRADVAAGQVGYLGEGKTDATWKSGLGAVSVGTTTSRWGAMTRQITNLAAGTKDTDAVNVAQLKALEKKVGVHYVSVTPVKKDETAGSNYLNDGAKGDGGIAIGQNATSQGRGIAMGYKASATPKEGTKQVLHNSFEGIAIGQEAHMEVPGGIALGLRARVEGTLNTKDGNVNEQGTVALGTDAYATGNGAAAFGWKAKGIGEGAMAFGKETEAKESGTAFGGRANAAAGAVAMGWQANANDAWAMSIGTSSDAKGKFSTALGGATTAEAAGSTAVGFATTSKGVLSTAVGAQSVAEEENSIALGAGSVANTKAGEIGYIATGGSATFEEALKTLNKKEDYDKWTATVNASKAEYDNLTQAFNDASKDKKDEAKAALDEWKKEHKDFVNALEAKSKLEATWRATKAAVSVGADGVDKAGNKIIESRQITNVAAGTQDTDAVNVAQLKALNDKVDNGVIHYYSVTSDKKAAGSNFDNDGAKAADSMVIGIGSSSEAPNSTVLGNNNTLKRYNADQNGSSSRNNIVVGQNMDVEGAHNAVFGTDYQNNRENRKTMVAGKYNTVIGVGNLAGYTAEKDPQDRSKWIYSKVQNGSDSGNVVVGMNNTATRSSIVIGADSEASSHGTSVGSNNKVIGNGDKGLALGNSLTVDGEQAVAIGSDSQAKADYAVAIGQEALAEKESTIAFGNSAKAQNEYSVAFGSFATATARSGVALGSSSLANREKGAIGYLADANTTSEAWKATRGAISIGNSDKKYTRQLTGLAAGTKDTDAVNVAQLKAVNTKVDQNKTDITNLKNISGKVINGTNTTVEEGDDNGTKTYKVNVATNGQIAENNTGIVTGDTVYKFVNTKVSTIETTVNNLKGGFTLKDANNGTVDVTLGEATKPAITFKAETKNTEGATSALTATVDKDKNVTYTLNTKKLKEEMGLTQGVGSMSSWKLKATDGTAETIADGDEVEFEVETADKGLTVKQVGKKIQYGIDSDKLIDNINSNTTKKITNVDGDNIDLSNNTSIKTINENITKLQKGSGVHYFSVKSTATGAGSNYDNDGATGENAIAIGREARAYGLDSSATGENAWSIGNYSQAWGYYALAGAEEGIDKAAYDALSDAEKKNYTLRELSIGGKDKSLYYRTTFKEYTNEEFNALTEQERKDLLSNKGYGYHSGKKVWTPTPRAIAIGHLSKALGAATVAVGNLAEATGLQSTAIGTQANASGEYGFAAGDRAKAQNTGTIAIGMKANASGEWSTAVGSFAEASGKWGTALGLSAKAQSENGVALGASASVDKKGAASIGYKAKGNVENGVALGAYSVADREKGKIGYVLGGDNSTVEKVLEITGQKAKYDELTGKIDPLKDEYNGLVKAYQKAPANSAEETTAKQKLDTWIAGHPDFLPAVKEKQQMIAAWQSGNGAVSVGSTSATRQITNLAAGSEDTDAVNVAQLKAVNKKVDKNAADITTINTDIKTLKGVSGKVVAGTNTTVTEGTEGETKTYAVNVAANGAIADGNTGIVNGDTVYKFINPISTKVSTMETTVNNLKGGFTIKGATSGTADITLGETTKPAITFKAETKDDDTTGVFTAKVDADKNVTYTLNTKKLKEEMGLAQGVGSMSSWKLKAGNTASQAIADGDEVEFAVETADKGLTVKREGKKIQYGINADKLVENINSSTTKITNVDGDNIDLSKNTSITTINENITKLAGKATKVTVNGKDDNSDDTNANLKIKKIEKDGQLTYDLSLNDELTIGKNGKDGKIGINGKDGKSADITVGKGEAGVDGKDGITRIIYKDQGNKTHEVATLDDGLKFKGDNDDVVIRKLNTQLNITGGAKAEDLSDDNIGVVGTDGDNGGMTVKLSKKLKGLTSAEFVDGDNITNITGGNVTITRKEGNTTNKVDLWELNKIVNNITAGTTDVSSWKLQANGANDRTIKKDSIVNFTNGTATKVTVKDNDVTVDLNDATKKQINDNTTNINNMKNDITNIQNTVNNIDTKIEQKIEGSKIKVEGDDKTGIKVKEDKVNGKVKGYKVSLDEKVKVGNVAIDGKDGKGEITGLTNTTVDAADFATKGRAATEEQLKAAMGKVQAQSRTTVKGSNNITVTPKTPNAAEYTVGLAKDISVDSVTAKKYKVGDKTYISDKGINANKNKITNVADGVVSKDSKDAVNGSQLFATNRQVLNNMNQINNLREESREGDALGAAMAALKPLDFDPYQRSQVMAGVGYYRGKEAVALGLAHYKNEDLMIHGGLAYAGNSELMANVGVSYRFGSSENREALKARNLRMPQYDKGPISSVYILQDEVERLTKENKEANDRIAALEAKLEKVLEKVK